MDTKENLRRLLIVREKDAPTDAELFMAVDRLLKRWFQHATLYQGSRQDLVDDTRAILTITKARLSVVKKRKAAEEEEQEVANGKRASRLH